MIRGEEKKDTTDRGGTSNTTTKGEHKTNKERIELQYKTQDKEREQKEHKKHNEGRTYLSEETKEEEISTNSRIFE